MKTVTVIIQNNNTTVIYRFKNKGFKYLFCIIKNKILGNKVEVIE